MFQIVPQDLTGIGALDCVDFLDPGAWPQDEIERSIYRRRISGASGSASRIGDRAAYPFCLPFLQDEFELSFDRSITIIAGENGTGKSTFLEGIAVLAGYDEAGGGKGYRPVDHSNAFEKMGGELSKALRASWLPKVTNGWFFRAESFFSVARYLDEVSLEDIPDVPPGIPPDFLSHSHGGGFLRFFQERCQRQGIFIFDEPESALS